MTSEGDPGTYAPLVAAHHAQGEPHGYQQQAQGVRTRQSKVYRRVVAGWMTLPDDGQQHPLSGDDPLHQGQSCPQPSQGAAGWARLASHQLPEPQTLDQQTGEAEGKERPPQGPAHHTERLVLPHKRENKPVRVANSSSSGPKPERLSGSPIKRSLTRSTTERIRDVSTPAQATASRTTPHAGGSTSTPHPLGGGGTWDDADDDDDDDDDEPPLMRRQMRQKTAAWTLCLFMNQAQYNLRSQAPMSLTYHWQHCKQMDQLDGQRETL
ncbi:hypothetical protein CRUP_002969 [Coryphaenoides rupestris]|nr:hypothetical protein CRUP_002969 [Coryphaenoides rupestris]